MVIMKILLIRPSICYKLLVLYKFLANENRF